MNKLSKLAVLLTSIALVMVFACGGSGPDGATNTNDPLSVDDISAAADKSGLNDSPNSISSDPVRTEDGLRLSFQGPNALDVGQSSTLNVRLANHSGAFRPEDPFNFQQRAAKLLSAGPISVTDNKPVPNNLEISLLGTYVYYYDITCVDTGTANITFSSSGQSGITDPTSAYSSTVEFSLICREPPPTEVVVVDEKPMLFVTYGIDGRPYPRAQFRLDDGHPGCTPPHVHSEVTVYPLEEWLIRGGGGEVQVTGERPLTDPEPDKCGFGRPVTLGPPNVLAMKASAVKFCEIAELSWIETRTELEEINLSRLIDLCNSFRQ